LEAEVIPLVKHGIETWLLGKAEEDLINVLRRKRLWIVVAPS